MRYRNHFLTTLFVSVFFVCSAIPALALCEDESGDTSEPPPEYDVSKTIALSEIYADPVEGEEEFIELKNNGSGAVNLLGWKLVDASGKTYTVNNDQFSSTTVTGGGYFVIPQSISKIYLNNDADSIKLVQPNENVLDSTSYEDAEKGVSWSFKNTWQWTTTVTNGKSNVITTAPTEDDEGGDSESGSEDEPEVDDDKLETSKDIELSELLPDPAGLDSTDEWIEIHNKGSKNVYLGGWQLTDQTTYSMIENVTINGGERLVFEVGVTGINLNNTGDTVYLIDPYGEIINGTTYEGSNEGMAWAFINGEWQWTAQPTPGEENVLAAVEGEGGEDDGTGSGEETGGDGQEADTVGIELFRSLEDGQSGMVEGVVTVLPDVFGSQYFYIQDENSGIQVYSYSKSFPEMAVGDRIQVTGEKSTARGETRIKIKAAEDIVVVGSGETVVPRDAVGLDESLEGMVVQTEGVVTESSSTEAMINDQIHVVLKESAGIDKALLEEGTSVSLIGIEGQYDDDYRMMPRSNEDITGIEQDNAAIPAANASEGFGTNPDSLGDGEQKSSWLTKENAIYLFVILGLLSIVAGNYLRKHKEKVLQFFGKKPKTDAKNAKPQQTLFDIARSVNEEHKKKHTAEQSTTLKKQ